MAQVVKGQDQEDQEEKGEEGVAEAGVQGDAEEVDRGKIRKPRVPPGEPHQVPRQDVQGHLPGDGGKRKKMPLKPHRQGTQEQSQKKGGEEPGPKPKPRGKPSLDREEGGGVGPHAHEGRLGEAGHPR